jgi:hypothetical protein
MSIPDPERFERLPQCARCGYDLSGVAVDAPCPECGASTGPFLVLAGIPAKIGGPVHRRAARIAVVLVAIVSSQAVFILLMVNWMFALAGFVLFVAAVWWLIASSPRERGGTERFVIGASGLARTALKAENVKQGDTAFCSFATGHVIAIEPVGTQWAKLRVRTGTGDKVFEAGVRIHEHTMQLLQSDLHSIVAPAGVHVKIEAKS